MLFSLLVLAAGAAGEVMLTERTALLGPSFISNFDLTNATAISQAKAAMPGIIDGLFEDESLNATDLIFAVDVYSAATNKSIYSYTYVGEGQEEALTAGKLDDRTIFRTGSVSKLFTVYTLLAKAGLDVLNKPVTHYLPELRRTGPVDPLTQIDFDQITVGALCSHQAGIGGAQGALSANAERITEVTPQDLFDYVLTTSIPTTAPYEKAIYADGGFAILTIVVERVTGKPYGQAVSDILSQPLELEDTSYPIGSDEGLNGVNRSTIGEPTSWGIDIDIVAGSGGIYSSAADLRKLGLSILNTEVLSPRETRHWMKPLGATGSLVELVGAPWEIARLTVPTSAKSNHTRVSDLYMKAGGTSDFGAIFAISPDHGVGISVLAAGRSATTARFVLRDAVAEAFIPAAEDAAFNHAKNNFVGTFVDESNKGANLTLSVDKNRAGLTLDSIFYNSTDMAWVIASRTAEGPLKGSLGVYPTGVTSKPGTLSALYDPNFTGVIAHRAVLHPEPLSPRAAVEGGEDAGMFENQAPWMNIDFLGPLDLLQFGYEKGKLVSVTAVGLNATYTRV